MSIAIYSDLKTAVANWLLRSDLTARIPDFITLAQTRIHYGSQLPPVASDPLRIRAMETTSQISVTGRTASLPSGFLQARRIYLSDVNGSATKLDMVSPDQLWSTDLSLTGSTPTAYAIEGENFVFGPSPDTTYTANVLYYKAFAALAADGDTNWLLTNSPGTYLYGALTEAFAYIRAFDKAQEFLAAFSASINALQKADMHDRFSGKPWIARTDTGNP